MATAFERFQGWMLCTVRHVWLAVRAKVYKEDKALAFICATTTGVCIGMHWIGIS